MNARFNITIIQSYLGFNDNQKATTPAKNLPFRSIHSNRIEIISVNGCERGRSRGTTSAVQEETDGYNRVVKKLTWDRVNGE